MTASVLAIESVQVGGAEDDRQGIDPAPPWARPEQKMQKDRERQPLGIAMKPAAFTRVKPGQTLLKDAA